MHNDVNAFSMSATYSPEDNKLRLYSSHRLDADTYARVKAAGFTFAPKQDLFVAPMWTPQREDLLIELCGEIGDEDTTLADRAEDRADRFGDYSASRASDANAARAAVASIADGIPFGQPILVGHHSERRARKDAERIESGMRRAVQMWDQSEYWKRRAAGAIRHAQYKERPDVRHRRIKTLEADQRKARRSLDDIEAAAAGLAVDGLTYEQAIDLANTSRVLYGLWSTITKDPENYAAACARTIEGLQANRAHYARWFAHYENRIAYERAMLGEQGGLKADAFDIQTGGQVLIDGEWLLVKRVNKKDGRINSVSTNARYVPVRGIEEVKDYRAPTAEEAATRKAAAKLPPMCNYPGDGFHHMTKAQWDDTHGDYKGSRELGQGAQRPGGYRPDIRNAADAAPEHGRHRVRVVVRAGGLSPVYITDAKRTDPPAPAKTEAVAALPQPEPVAAPAQQAAPRVTAAPNEFDAMRDQLRQGVQVVSAPQLFPTPQDVAARMVELADLDVGHRVLEPEAGTGAIIREIAKAVALDEIELCAVEINARLADMLRESFPDAQVTQADFLGFQPVASDAPLFDRILMNPPFADAQDIKHILHARALLAPGGRLVAICAHGPRQIAALKPLAEGSGGVWEPLPSGAFAASGTNVSTVLLTIESA